jgi:hypothetical protein
MSRIVMPMAGSQIHGAEPIEKTSALVIRALLYNSDTEGPPGDAPQRRTFFDSVSVPE